MRRQEKEKGEARRRQEKIWLLFGKKRNRKKRLGFSRVIDPPSTKKDGPPRVEADGSQLQSSEEDSSEEAKRGARLLSCVLLYFPSGPFVLLALVFLDLFLLRSLSSPFSFDSITCSALFILRSLHSPARLITLY
jgi:hypothetical protein